MIDKPKETRDIWLRKLHKLSKLMDKRDVI